MEYLITYELIKCHNGQIVCSYRETITIDTHPMLWWEDNKNWKYNGLPPNGVWDSCILLMVSRIDPFEITKY